MFRSKLLNTEFALTFRDIIILPGYSEVEPSSVDLSTKATVNYTLKIPLISSPMDTVTEEAMAIGMARLGGLGIIHRNMSVNDQVNMLKKIKHADPIDLNTAVTDDAGRLLVGAAVSPYDAERAKMVDRYADIIVVDVAHFHNKNVISATKKILSEVSADIVVGNIGTYKAAEDIVTGIDGVAGLRVGVSSGSICITGEVTGVAAPTLYAVACVADALRDYGAKIPIIADGGIKSAGDIAKAFAVGASTAMLGYMLAGTDEAPGAMIEVNGRKYKYYRGMGSKAARERRYVLDRYSKPSKEIVEGVEGYVPYTGSLEDVIKKICNGLKAALGYAGAACVTDMWNKARLARLTPAGVKEVYGVDVVQFNIDQ